MTKRIHKRKRSDRRHSTCRTVFLSVSYKFTSDKYKSDTRYRITASVPQQSA